MARKTRQSNKTTPAKNTKAGKAKVNAAVTSAKKATAAANKIAATTKTSSENTSSSSTARASKGLLQLAINWDTTGSMYPCLSQVKGKVKDMVKKVTERYNGPVEFRLSANGDQ